MSTVTVTSKGQITIPVEVRQALQVKAGDRVEFVQIEPVRFEVVAATRPVTAGEAPSVTAVTLAGTTVAAPTLDDRSPM